MARGYTFTEQDLEYLGRFDKFLTEQEMVKIEQLRKEGNIEFEDLKIAMNIFGTKIVPIIKTESYQHKDFAIACNQKVKKGIQKILYERFAKEAHEKIPELIAPNIVGFESIKGAVALQLFAKESVHILLLGDPGTGKTDILRSAADFSPISSFGLGSGTTGVGLVGTYKGFEFIPGLLPQAHEGLCAIDELNLLKEESRAGLYNAMEKGFVSYDKAGTHERMDAKVNILATANPKGDSFIDARKLWEVKKQIPFDPALMTRFHLIFLINKPTSLQFENITKSIASQRDDSYTENDLQFLKGYIALARKKNVLFPKEYESEVINYIKSVKEREAQLLSEVTPRMVLGFMNLVKASARMNMRDRVSKEDIERVKLIFEQAINLNIESIIPHKEERRPVRNTPARGYR